MSNLRTRLMNELMGGSDYDDLDCYYPPFTEHQILARKAKKAQASALAEKESRDVSAQQGLPFVVGRVHEEP